MTENNKPPLWRSVVSDAVTYDPLTGTYKYREPIDTTPDQVNYLSNQFWTPMGQPRRIHTTIDETLGIEIDMGKERSPRKEKKKPKKKQK